MELAPLGPHLADLLGDGGNLGLVHVPSQRPREATRRRGPFRPFLHPMSKSLREPRSTPPKFRHTLAVGLAACDRPNERSRGFAHANEPAGILCSVRAGGGHLSRRQTLRSREHLAKDRVCP
jgi:hypothetical protein